MEVKITFAMPPRILSPNHTVGSRGSRMAKAAATKKARTLAKVLFMATFAANFRPRWKHATCKIVWYSKTVVRPDRDNAIGTMKAYFDGLADAGLLHNDRGLTQLPPIFFVDRDKPRVELTFTT